MYFCAVERLAVHLTYRIESVALLVELDESIVHLRWEVTVPNVTEFSELGSDVVLRHCRREAADEDGCVVWVLAASRKINACNDGV